MIISDFIKWQENQSVASDFQNYIMKKYGPLSEVAVDMATELFQIANIIAHLDNKIEALTEAGIKSRKRQVDRNKKPARKK